MPQSGVAPTRSNLLGLQRELRLAQRGHDLLDEKRRALILEVMTMVQDAEAGQARMNEEFRAAYQALLLARMSLGTDRLEWIALSAAREPEASIRHRRIMGVPVSTVEPVGSAPNLQYGLGDTTVALDEAFQRFRDLLPVVMEMAETLTAVWRLTREIQRTQRRVKALENVTIARLKRNIRFIQDSLEEKEREEFFRAKRVKESLER